MNVTDARVFLKSVGWFTYERINGWIVYDPNGYNGFYDNRGLIHLAQSRRKPNWRPFASPKSAIGCGGKWCTCCTKAPPAEMKKWERKAARRNGKKYSPFDDSMEYHESFA